MTRPKIPLYPRVSLQLQTMLEAALTGRLDPAAAAAHAAELIEAITGLPIARHARRGVERPIDKREPLREI